MFHDICLDDKKLFDKYMFPDKATHSQYNFTNLYMWRHELKPTVCEFKDYLCIHTKYYGHEMALFPIGESLAGARCAIDMMLETFGNKLTFAVLDDEKSAALEALYPGKFKFYENRANYDYVYLTERLITLSGKKLHAKRNHINKFKAEFDYEYKSLNTGLLKYCEEIERSWLENKDDMSERDKKSELLSTMNVLDNFDYLGCRGGIVFIDGKPAAYSIGEMMTDKTALIHIEKADRNIEGLYPIINQLTCENEFSDSLFVDREEDMGLETLRKAKLSYHPDKLLKSDRARLKKCL